MSIVETRVFDSQGNVIKPVEETKEKVLVEVSSDTEDTKQSPKRRRQKKEVVLVPDGASSIPEDEDEIKDPVALKLESALKRSIADRTGNLQLKQEAAREQSRADKMGARAVLSRQQQERAKKEAEALRAEAAVKQSLADRTGNATLKKEAAAQQHLADKLIAHANKALAAIAAVENGTNAQETVAPSSPTPTPASVSDVPASEAVAVSSPVQPRPTTPPPSLAVPVAPSSPATVAEPSSELAEALKAAKAEAARLQSIADRTGDLKAKQQAAIEQSKADKLRALLKKDTAGTALTATGVPLTRITSGFDIQLTKKAEGEKAKGLSMRKIQSACDVSLKAQRLGAGSDSAQWRSSQEWRPPTRSPQLVHSPIRNPVQPPSDPNERQWSPLSQRRVALPAHLQALQPLKSSAPLLKPTNNNNNKKARSNSMGSAPSVSVATSTTTASSATTTKRVVVKRDATTNTAEEEFEASLN